MLARSLAEIEISNKKNRFGFVWNLMLCTYVVQMNVRENMTEIDHTGLPVMQPPHHRLLFHLLPRRLAFQPW